MPQLAAATNILNFVTNKIIEQLAHWDSLLLEGDFRQAEQAVFDQAQCLFDHVMVLLVEDAAQRFCTKEKSERSNLEVRSQKVQLRTGTSFKVDGLYQKRVEQGETGSRHLLERHWGFIAGASPGLYDVTSHAALIGPSYDQAQCLLARHGVKRSVSGIRRLTNSVAEQCVKRGEAELIVEPTESLAGKRVLISSDGGRSRIREYTGQFNERGQPCYTTPYKEPKLFVIEVLNDEGRLSEHHLPIYGCRFGKQDHLDLLKEYLVRLDIDQASEVQLVADGAAWIWNEVPELLKNLGVAAERVTLTLDYYHAMQHLHSLFECLPKRIGKKQTAKFWSRCKDWLWQGKTSYILRLFRWLYKRIPKQARTEMNYFETHKDHTQYADYQRRKLACGSGVIESAIRRIVNLRFKNNSTFWEAEKLEKLYFLRGAILSKRWDYLIENLANRS